MIQCFAGEHTHTHTHTTKIMFYIEFHAVYFIDFKFYVSSTLFLGCNIKL